MDLDGKIALRLTPGPIESEVTMALEHGAGGLILLGKKASTKSMLAKTPLPVKSWAEYALPVLVLSGKGYRLSTPPFSLS